MTPSLASAEKNYRQGNEMTIEVRSLPKKEGLLGFKEQSELSPPNQKSIPTVFQWEIP